MRLGTICFFMGILFLQYFSMLPPLVPTLFLALLFILIIGFTKLSVPIKQISIGFVLGFCWVVLYAHWKNDYNLPSNLEGVSLPVAGIVSSIPVQNAKGESFLFSVNTINQKSQSLLIKLSWIKNSVPLHAGQEWRLTVRLKKIHGQLNPGGFDYEKYAYQKGIRAQGYVLTKAKNQLITHHWYNHPVDQLREYLKDVITHYIPQSTTSQWIPALSVGERENIPPKDWEVLRSTGTNHLMAIAGLHIGFMAALAHFITQFFWKRSRRLLNLLPSIKAGAISALLIALIYSTLAGFALPTQRACFMLGFFLSGILFRRNIPITQAWFLAFLFTLVFNPLLILADSFWLSFASVGLIFYGMGGRILASGWWWKWGRVQWVITVGLIPFGLWLFQEISFTSFLANSIAIPCVEFILVPLCFFGTLCLMVSLKLGGLLLTLADKILGVLWMVLQFFANFPGALWHQSMPNGWVFAATSLVIIFCLAPKYLPGKFFSFIFLLPLLVFKPTGPQPGEISFTLLDVGQGLSAVAQTAHHLLVFDAGAKLSDSYDMGASVVVPYLRTLAASSIDKLVISHEDNDHIGGAYALLKAFPVQSIQTSVPDKFIHASYCLRGEHWQWDGVDFEFLYPETDDLGLDNDSSCVLKISTPFKSILLTGDIENFAEKELVKLNRKDLLTTILVAPHHGSKTSIQKSFVNAVHPQLVLFPLGYRNRYHFPHPSVVKCYTNLHSEMQNTADAGAINILIDAQGRMHAHAYRSEHKAFWNN